MTRLATIYHPGAYGTFISWCIFSFSNLNTRELVEPIGQYGSGHRYRKHPNFQLVRPTHYILNNYQNYVVLEFSKERLINYHNNQFEKHLLADLPVYLSELDSDYHSKLINNWGTTDNWAVREFLSMYLYSEITQNITQFDLIDKESTELNCFYVSPEEFLLHPEQYLTQIYSFFNLTTNAYFDQINTWVGLYLSKQKYFNRHAELKDFVNAAIKNQKIILKFANIFDEAYIQASFKLLGYNLNCYGLNEFPRSSLEIHRLLDK